MTHFKTSNSTECKTVCTQHILPTLLHKELELMMTQRHLEVALLPSDNYQYDINIVENLAEMINLHLEGAQPVHYCSITRVLVPSSRKQKR